MDLAIHSLKIRQRSYFALMKLNQNVATHLMAMISKLLKAHHFLIEGQLVLVIIMEKLSRPAVRNMKNMKSVDQRLKL